MLQYKISTICSFDVIGLFFLTFGSNGWKLLGFTHLIVKHHPILKNCKVKLAEF